MPAAQSPTTRARDLDRSTLCTVLDTAYADGQLDKADHGARTTAALAAKTLGELRALTDDLQVEHALPPLRTPRPAGEPSRGRRMTTGLLASLVLLGVGFGIGYASGSSSASPSASAEAAAGPGDDVAPVVVAQQGLHTREGFAALLAATRARFGSAMVGEAVIYPDYAVITMPAPGAPGRAQRFLYRGGFDEPSNAGTRPASDPLVDLGAVQVDGVLGLLAGAGETLAVPDPTSRYLIVDQDGGSPYVSVYASNEFGESGYVRAGLDGAVMAVHPYKAG